MTIVLLSDDLMLASIVDGAATRVGATVHMTGSSAEAVSRCDGHSPTILVVDLRRQGIDLAELVGEVRQLPRPTWVMACGPHVHDRLLEAAVAAGCDEVVTRGEFQRRLTASVDRLRSGAFGR